MQSKAVRQRNNELACGYFALAMVGMMVVFSVVHYVDIVLQKSTATRKDGSMGKMASLWRYSRSILLRKVPGFPTIGHLIVFIIFFAINILLTFWRVDWSMLNFFAKRLGWIAGCDFALIIVLALKNTPLALLTSYSYERLNILHQAGGYCAVFWTILHGIIYLVALAKSHALSEVFEAVDVIMGPVAGIAAIIAVLAAVFIRRRQYEVFYILHIVFFLLLVIAFGMHRPMLATKTLYIPIFIGSIWTLDRLMRFSKLAVNFFSNSATLTALPHGGIRIVCKKTPWRAVPGSHAFLWLPFIRKAETHPFTIVNTNPLEFIVAAQDGFTRDMFHMLTDEKGVNRPMTVKASVDGPYGTTPEWTNFDRVVLVAGGSGATFTFGAANHILDTISKKDIKAPIINFIWVIRDSEQLTWFSTHLSTLAAHPNVHLTIHVTNQSDSYVSTRAPTRRNSLTGSGDEKEKEKGITVTIPAPAAVAGSSRSSSTATATSPTTDIEKSITPTNNIDHLVSKLTLHPGRPDLVALLHSLLRPGNENVSEKSSSRVVPEKTVVAVCGPRSMRSVVRSTVANEIGNGGENAGRIRLHCETFGY